MPPLTPKTLVGYPAQERQLPSAAKSPPSTTYFTIPKPIMSSKAAVSKPSDTKDAEKPAQKPNVSLEEDDEFEDFPVEGELPH